MTKKSCYMLFLDYNNSADDLEGIYEINIEDVKTQSLKDALKEIEEEIKRREKEVLNKTTIALKEVERKSLFQSVPFCELVKRYKELESRREQIKNAIESSLEYNTFADIVR